ncbi:amino acid ABC transporter permease [Segnochrobactraceae bacterium EtOH-i3]
MTLIAFVGAFPVAVLLALGRRSAMGGIRLFSTVVVEVMRGVPFIAVLYVVMLLVPLALPAELTMGKLARALAGMTLFIAAYMAEIVRAGLQAVPAGQAEAAGALGFGYWGTLRRVVLPQALRAVIPSFVNLGTGLFQETTLVVVIGMFDFLNAARVAATDPAWLGFYDEAFAFAAAVYFVVCLAASRYSLWLEARLRPPGR